MRRSLALVLGLTVAAGCSHGVQSASHGATVPWIDSPGQIYFPQPVPTTVPPADATPCRADQLSVGGEENNGGGGHLDHIFSFVNRSASTCLLAGVPSVEASEPGHVAVVAATHGGFFVGHGERSANMAPGQTTELALETDSECPPAPTTSAGLGSLVFHTVTVRLPGGGGDMTFSASLDVRCGLYTGAFFVPSPPLQYVPVPWPGLRVSLQLPPSASAGRTLSYVVVMANPSDHAVVLNPCPSYTEGINAAGKTFLLLNCRGGGQIGAHEQRRYAMDLPIPRDTAPGPAKVYWMFATPAETPASGSLTVVGS